MVWISSIKQNGIAFLLAKIIGNALGRSSDSPRNLAPGNQRPMSGDSALCFIPSGFVIDDALRQTFGDGGLPTPVRQHQIVLVRRCNTYRYNDGFLNLI
jgi:hypothetical protein